MSSCLHCLTRYKNPELSLKSYQSSCVKCLSLVIFVYRSFSSKTLRKCFTYLFGMYRRMSYINDISGKVKHKNCFYH